MEKTRKALIANYTVYQGETQEIVVRSYFTDIRGEQPVTGLGQSRRQQEVTLRVT